MHRSIKVKVVKETKNNVTLRILSTNSRMLVKREEFEQRKEDGTYEIIE